MKNVKNIKKPIWIAGAIIFLGLCVYSALLPPLLFPRNEALPDREIVFRYWDNRWTAAHIGFIDPDGSGFETRDVIVPTGFFDYDFAFKRYTAWLHTSVRWSENGDAIGLQYLRYAPTGGIPFLIDLNGKFTFCPVKSIPCGKYNGGIVFLGDDKIVSIRDDITHKDEVVVYDMQMCQEVETVYTAEEGEYLREAPISKTGRIALWHYVNKQNQVTILLPDKTVQAIFEDATQPAWSKDGEYLAFVKPDGLYIATKDGNNLERVLEAPHIDCPSWGPDGDRLAMEYPNATVSVLDLMSGEVTEIVENGACPDWR